MRYLSALALMAVAVFLISTSSTEVFAKKPPKPEEPVPAIQVRAANGDLLGRLVNINQSGIWHRMTFYNDVLGKFLLLEDTGQWLNALGEVIPPEDLIWWWDPVMDDYYEFWLQPPAGSYMVLKPPSPSSHTAGYEYFIISVTLNSVLNHYEPVLDPAKPGQYRLVQTTLPFQYPVQGPLQFE